MFPMSNDIQRKNYSQRRTACTVTQGPVTGSICEEWCPSLCSPWTSQFQGCPQGDGSAYQKSPVKCLWAPRARDLGVQPHLGPCSLASGGTWEDGEERQTVQLLRPSGFLSTKRGFLGQQVLCCKERGSASIRNRKRKTLHQERNQPRQWAAAPPAQYRW